MRHAPLGEEISLCGGPGRHKSGPIWHLGVSFPVGLLLGLLLRDTNVKSHGNFGAPLRQRQANLGPWGDFVSSFPGPHFANPQHRNMIVIFLSICGFASNTSLPQGESKAFRRGDPLLSGSHFPEIRESRNNARRCSTRLFLPRSFLFAGLCLTWVGVL